MNDFTGTLPCSQATRRRRHVWFTLATLLMTYSKCIAVTRVKTYVNMYGSIISNGDIGTSAASAVAAA